MRNGFVIGSRLFVARTLMGVVGLLWLLLGTASALVTTGSLETPHPDWEFDPNPPTGMALTLTIDPAITTFEMTGPADRWFAFGFSTQTMQGYTLIVQGEGDSRTVDEYLIGFGDPGPPLVPNTLNIVSQEYDSANELSTLVVERTSVLGEEPMRLDFLTSWSELDAIWAYDSFNTGTLDYHGNQGRGRGIIRLAVIPEPSTLVLVLAVLAAGVSGIRMRRYRQ